MHPEMWKSPTSSAGTDLRLDLQTWQQSRLEAAVAWDWCSKADITSDAMLIFISDSVSLDVSGIEAVAAAAEGLWGDLNAEDLETLFLLM